MQSHNRASTNSDVPCRLYRLPVSTVAIPQSGFHKFRRDRGYLRRRYSQRLQSHNRASTNSDADALDSVHQSLTLQSQNRASTHSDKPYNGKFARVLCDVAIPQSGFHTFRPTAGPSPISDASIVAIPKSGFHKFRRRRIFSDADLSGAVAIPKSGFHKFRLNRMYISGGWCIVAIPKSGFHKFRLVEDAF